MLNIIVFVKEVPDVRISINYRTVTGRVHRDWTVYKMNPADRTALNMALKVRHAFAGSHLMAVHLGPQSGEELIRECLALGCDDGLRLWDEEFEGLQPPTKALVFSRVATILGFDLILTGSRSQDTGNGQTNLLLASILRVPCITSAVGCEIGSGAKVAKITKMLSRGYHAFIESPLPLVVGVDSARLGNLDSSLALQMEVCAKKIPCWNLADLGIPKQRIVHMESILELGALKLPRSKLRFVETPDSALPGYLRIKKLVEGTVSAREGKVIQGPEDQVAAELFDALLREKWLEHIGKNR